MQSWRSASIVPSADAASFGGQARRHLVARLLLAAALIATLAAAIVVARGLDPEEAAFVPRGRNAIVVLDLSKSVEARGYARVARVLNDVIAAKQPVGLVIFSDAPYVLLPAGSPAEQLRPLLRYFKPVRGSGAGAQYPPNPWRQGFSGGTSVSAGVELGRDALRRQHVRNASIVLVSDLDVPVSDVPRLTRVLIDLRRGDVTFRVIPLFPNSDARYVFERIAGREAFVDPRRLGHTAGGVHRFAAPSSRTLLLVSGLLILLLAANERWFDRLRLSWRSA